MRLEWTRVFDTECKDALTTAAVAVERALIAAAEAGDWLGGMELLDERLAGQDLPVRYNDQLANEIGPYVRASEGQISMPFAFGPGADIVTQTGGYPMVLNHEHEHLRQYADILNQNPDARNGGRRS